jgi:processive 1,2-diacylglycerol beta-glucosyltransferase
MKVLITSVRAGSGHVRAAEAIAAAFQRSRPNVSAAHVDAIDLVSPGFRRFYLSGYNVAVNRAPALWGRLYRFWDDRSPDSGLTPWLYRTQRHFAEPFFQFVRDFKPDLILSTHFLIPQLLAAKGAPSFGIPVECVITDYDVHQFWVSEVVSRYYVAHEGMIPALRRRGVPLSRVVVSGIPVHPCFSDPIPLEPVFQSLDLDPQEPVILVLGGGLGLNRLKEAVERLLTLPGWPQIVTVAGRNDALRSRLNELRFPSTVRLLNLGYVDNMYELLNIANLVITKPGGLTVSECLALRKLMVLVSPIPGQEEKNADFLISREAALKAETLEELPSVVTRLLTDGSLRGQIRRNMEAYAQPDAVYTIAQTAVAAARVAAA